MLKLRLAIIGFGRLGKACAQAIHKDERLLLAGIVRRPESVAEPLPEAFAEVPVVTHISELGAVDAALLCVPTEEVLGVAREILQHRTPIVECASLHGEAFLAHKDEIGRYASNYKNQAIVGAGWDPGVLSVFRSLFALFCPTGHTEITRRPGINLHHSTVASAITGVKSAMATEIRAADGRRQNYFYLELEEGAEAEVVERAIRNDPLFANEEVLVFPVESIATMEEEGHGVLLERRGAAGGTDHQLFLLEARFSEYALCAQVMTTAVQALSSRGKRAYSLMDLPLNALWGELKGWAEEEWE